jgi:putative ABC transport system permease protein
MFENSDAPTKSMTEKQFQLQFMEMMGNVKGLIHGISIVILFAVTLIVANTVAMSARERVTEIAVMRTLGFRRSHILGFILSESVLMSLLGGLLGVVLAKYLFIPGMVKGMETSPMAPFMLNFKVTWAVLTSAFGISVGVGVLAGFVPAIRSSQVKIVDGLRQVV